MSEFSTSSEVISKLKSALKEIIKGRDDTIDLVLTGLLANGHVLLEDYPGSGKTTLAKTLGNLIDCSSGHSERHYLAPFRRIQFTPDLLPTDVLGVNIFEPQSATFRLQHGPIFSHVILADEINRTGPKVQAAFLECMAERQVTIDNDTHALDDLFFVIGTQNPLDLAGTYPLPLVQLDRFLLKIPMTYVSKEDEIQILKESESIAKKVNEITPVVTREDILSSREAVGNITISEPILETLVNIVQATRTNGLFQFGASTRSAIMFKQALRAFAAVNGRDFVSEDDVKTLAPYVLQHRLRQTQRNADGDSLFQDFLNEHIEGLIRAH